MSPITLAVRSRFTVAALICPLTWPQTRTVSAWILPVTRAPSPTVSERLWMSPSTTPSIWRSPALVRLPWIFRSALMMEGAVLRAAGRGGASGALIPGMPALVVVTTSDFVLLLAFENIAPRFQEVHWVQGSSVDPHLVMHMGALAAPRAAEKPDLVAIVDRVAELHVDAGKMGIARVDAEAVVDLHHAAIAAFPTGEDHDARRGRRHRRQPRIAEIDPLMHG